MDQPKDLVYRVQKIGLSELQNWDGLLHVLLLYSNGVDSELLQGSMIEGRLHCKKVHILSFDTNFYSCKTASFKYDSADPIGIQHYIKWKDINGKM